MVEFEFLQSVPEETVLADPEIRYAKDVWLEMINNAQKKIDIGQFYIESVKGEAMEPVLNAIEEAGKRGVKVRVIIDKSLADNYPHNFLQGVENVELRKINMAKLTGSIMHAKYMIIDEKESFIGSQNFDWRSLTQVHEMGFRLVNEGFAKVLTRVFETDWKACETEELPAFEKSEKRESPVFTSRFQDEEIKIKPAFSPEQMTPSDLSLEIDEILNLINNAQSELLLNVMEFSVKSSYSPLILTKHIFALIDAAVRGVKVKLLISNWATKEPSISFLKSLALIPNIEVKISSLPRLKNKFIPFARVQHCKYLIVDRDKLWLGTTNWEPDYFLASRNMSVVIEGKSTNKKLRDVFFNSWTAPYAEYVDVAKKYIPPTISN